MMRRLLLPLMLVVSAAAPVLASPQTALAAAVADAEKLPEDVAYRTRYFMLRRPKIDEALLVKAWANHLSREVEFGTPRVVSAEVLAVLLDDYRWKAAVWETQAKREPYFHFHERRWYPGDAEYEAGWYRYPATPPLLDAKLLCRLEKLTSSKVPLVRADWWLFYTHREIDLDSKDIGFGYSGWLEVKNLADFEALRAVDRKVSIRLGLELRAAIEEGRSGVAQKDRQVEWFATYGDGDFWLTLDTNDSSRGNTAPGNLGPGEFKPKAFEAYISLPNDLWGMGLFKADAKLKNPRQATAPDFIGPADFPLRQGRDGRIHNGQCNWCHLTGGLQPIDDWARRTLRPPRSLDAHSLEDYIRARRQYTGSLDARLEKGRQRYLTALKKLTGLGGEEFARKDAEAYYDYHPRPRTRADVAEDLGVADARLERALIAFFDPRGKSKEADRKRLAIFAGFTPDKAGETQAIPVKAIEDFFSDLQAIVRDYS